jgi:hypothetical protein
MPSMVREECLNVGLFIEAEDGRIASKFLGRLSRVRSVYLDADLALLKIATGYYAKEYPIPSPQGVLFVAERSASLDELVRANQGILSLTPPRTTLGSDMSEEMDELFAEFVEPLTPLSPRPISSIQLAQSNLRRQVEGWLTKSSLCAPGRYRKNFEVPGTVAPWAFDFGFENGHITAVQVVGLTGPLDVLMNRAALVSARATDTWEASREAGREKPDIVAVSDAEPRSEPVQYLNNRKIDVLSLAGESGLRERLGAPLAQAGIAV